MKRNIIFLSGFMIPNSLAKTRFMWNDSIWKDYNRIYLTSKIPRSELMIKRRLYELTNIINTYSDVTVAGHSLGAWWAANLACLPQCKIKKLVMWTPLVDASVYPIFKVTPLYHPLHLWANDCNKGPEKSLVLYGNRDLIVPAIDHGHSVAKFFNSSSYTLKGGHVYQSNHKAGLLYMKNWIEKD